MPSPTPLPIDGSQGEGGGQILRTSMALAAITNTPIHIKNIRAKRDKPGLMRQHLTAVQSASQVCNGHLEGADLHSRELLFTPGKIRGDTYHFATGSAGSVTLVLQTVIPILLQAEEPSHLTLIGGTHNIFAPPADYLIHAFLRQLKTMGAQVDINIERHGFYPAGGGKLTATINPGKLSPLHLHTRGELTSKTARGVIADLHPDIALRELDLVKKRLGFTDEEARPHQLPPGQGPGNILLLRYDYEHVTEVFTGFGAKGTTAEAVAEKTIAETRDYLKTSAPVGPHLADQLLLPLALAVAADDGSGGAFTTTAPTLHATTNATVIEMFLPIKATFEPAAKGTTKVTLSLK